MIKDMFNNNKLDEKTHNQEIIQSIMSLSERVRYVGIINKFGRTITGKLKKGIIPMLTPEQARDERYIESTRQHLRRSLEISIGKSVFTIEKNENVTFLLVPDISKDILYYITIEKEITLPEINEILDGILRMIHIE